MRVVTLNIWNKQGPWEERCALIRRGVETIDPDVIGLQEVLRLSIDGEARDQAEEIVAGLPYPHIAYGIAQNLGGGLTFGNAVVSRHPIVESHTFALPAPSGTPESRCLLYALVAAPWGRVPVFVTHLNWKFHESSTRVRQVQAIADHIMRIAPVDDVQFPPILMGDMNAEPDSDEMRYLRGLATIDGRSVFFADAWTWGGDGGPGYTYDRRNPYAAVVGEPPRRIDYIFVRGPDRVLRGSPLRTRVVFDVPEGDVWPSDHFGVLTELRVEPQPPQL